MDTKQATPTLRAGNYIIRKGATTRCELIRAAGAKSVRLQTGVMVALERCDRRWVDDQIARGRMFVISAADARRFETRRKALYAKHGKPSIWSPKADAYAADVAALAVSFCR